MAADRSSSSSAYKKAMWAGKSNLLVCVRVRPLWTREARTTVEVVEDKLVVCKDPGRDASDVLRKGRSRERRYAFDHAYGPEAPTALIYEQTTAFLLEGVMTGYNATVLAYGATGSGKTFTMLGTPTSPGIMLLTLKELYERVGVATGLRPRGSDGGSSLAAPSSAASAAASGGGKEIKVTLSYVEIYNENIRDLLSDTPDFLDLREDPVRGPTVAGVSDHAVSSPDEVMDLLARGNRRRTQEATAANSESSRSHAVLQIVVEQKDRGGDQLRIGKLTLLDLAGSERASNTKNRGIRLREGANINRSLLALGNVINALVTAKKGSYIPYRDSKLTRLLKDSLGGNCRTVMIATASPAASSFEETINTLKYADRAKKIKTKVTRNVLRVNYHISQYEELIGNLRTEIATLKDRIADQPRPGSGPGFGSDASGAGGEMTGFGGAVSPHGAAPGMVPGVGVGGMLTGASIVSSPAAAAMLLGSSSASAVAVSPGRSASSPRKDLAAALSSTDGGQRAQELRGRLVGNFQERMQLRRALIDLEAVNAQNQSEISKKQLESAKSEHSLRAAGGASAQSATLDRHKREAGRAIADLRSALASNSEAKQDLLRRLRDNGGEAKALREDIDRHASSSERKDLLDLQYRVGVLELENMELEHSRMLHDAVLRRKDLEIRRLRLQLRARDRLIAQQADVITSHRLAHLVDFAMVSAIDEQLGYDDEDDDDEEDDQDQDEDDEDEDDNDDEDDDLAGRVRDRAAGGASAPSSGASSVASHEGKDQDDGDAAPESRAAQGGGGGLPVDRHLPPLAGSRPGSSGAKAAALAAGLHPDGTVVAVAQSTAGRNGFLAPTLGVVASPTSNHSSRRVQPVSSVPKHRERMAVAGVVPAARAAPSGNSHRLPSPSASAPSSPAHPPAPPQHGAFHPASSASLSTPAFQQHQHQHQQAAARRRPPAAADSSSHRGRHSVAVPLEASRTPSNAWTSNDPQRSGGGPSQRRAGVRGLGGGNHSTSGSGPAARRLRGGPTALNSPRNKRVSPYVQQAHSRLAHGKAQRAVQGGVVKQRQHQHASHSGAARGLARRGGAGGAAGAGVGTRRQRQHQLAPIGVAEGIVGSGAIAGGASSTSPSGRAAARAGGDHGRLVQAGALGRASARGREQRQEDWSRPAAWGERGTGQRRHPGAGGGSRDGGDVAGIGKMLTPRVPRGLGNDGAARGSRVRPDEASGGGETSTAGGSTSARDGRGDRAGARRAKHQHALDPLDAGPAAISAPDGELSPGASEASPVGEALAAQRRRAAQRNRLARARLRARQAEIEAGVDVSALSPKAQGSPGQRGSKQGGTRNISVAGSHSRRGGAMGSGVLRNLQSKSVPDLAPASSTSSPGAIASSTGGGNKTKNSPTRPLRGQAAWAEPHGDHTQTNSTNRHTEAAATSAAIVPKLATRTTHEKLDLAEIPPLSSSGGDPVPRGAAVGLAPVSFAGSGQHREPKRDMDAHTRHSVPVLEDDMASDRHQRDAVHLAALPERRTGVSEMFGEKRRGRFSDGLARPLVRVVNQQQPAASTAAEPGVATAVSRKTPSPPLIDPPAPRDIPVASNARRIVVPPAPDLAMTLDKTLERQ